MLAETITIKAGTAAPAGAQVLDEADAFLRRFIVFPTDAAADAAAVWVAHTWAPGAFTASPRLAVLSTEPGSGKTFVLDLLALLCARPRREIDPTGPVIAAMIAQERATILLDECDTIWGKAGGGSHSQLRGILNAGYKQGATLSRMAGKDGLQSQAVYGPVAFAGLGNLPATLMDRSIVIRMRKRRAQEHAEAYYPRMHDPLGAQTGEALGDWIRSVTLELASSWPSIPDGVINRSAEIWSPLLAIADAAGGSWPARVRAACTELALDQANEPARSPAQRLLSDICLAWPGEADRCTTAELITRLFELDDAPWASMWAPEAAPRELASLLDVHDVHPRKLRLADGRTLSGYHRSDFPVPDVPAVPCVPDIDSDAA